MRYRRGTSDLSAFNQIFVQREYACLDDLVGVDLIVDCGAYVGYSSAYFLTQFPNSNIVAIEPDPENFSLLKKTWRYMTNAPHSYRQRSGPIPLPSCLAKENIAMVKRGPFMFVSAKLMRLPRYHPLIFLVSLNKRAAKEYPFLKSTSKAPKLSSSEAVPGSIGGLITSTPSPLNCTTTANSDLVATFFSAQSLRKAFTSAIPAS